MDADNPENKKEAAPDAVQNQDNQRRNSLVDLVTGLSPSPFSGDVIQGGNIISQPYTLRKDSTAGLLTLDWVTLTNAYAHIGIVQTLIDVPVDDAFRNGFKVNTNGQLDEDDMRLLMETMKEEGDLAELEQTLKWARLFGGSVLIAATDQDPQTPLNVESIGEGDDVRFVSADRWEAPATFVTMSGFQPGQQGNYKSPSQLPIGNYQYYDISLDPSRVCRVIGVPAPRWIRQLLMGWGMSELERCLREINSFLKFQDMIFELVDEAKIDVFKIDQFNNALATENGTQQIQARIQLANMLKNYKRALVMDKEDEYAQKQMGQVFNGLANIYEQMRMNLAAALKFPMDKLFGQSASGLNASGEDTIENYNSLVESVRHKAEPLLKWVLKLRCRTLFGFEPEMTIEWPALRVLSANEQEQVNTSKQNRALALYDRGLWGSDGLQETLQKEGLISVKLLAEPELRETGASASGDDEKPKGNKSEDSRGNAAADFKDGLEFLRAEKRRLRGASEATE